MKAGYSFQYIIIIIIKEFFLNFYPTA